MYDIETTKVTTCMEDEIASRPTSHKNTMFIFYVHIEILSVNMQRIKYLLVY